MDAAKARAAAQDEEAAAGGGASDGQQRQQQDQEPDEDRVTDLCVVCLEQPCGSVFAQCGHMCTCVGCSQQLQRCPICRAKTSSIRVYRT